MVRRELGADVVYAGDDPREVLSIRPLPDLLLLDLDLGTAHADPGTAGTLQQLGCQVLVVSAMADRQLIRAMIDAGVAGFVSKRESADTLIGAIREVLAEGSWTSPEVAAMMVSAPVRPHLSPAQEQVLVLYASGLKADAVARQLGVTVGTVNTHLKRARAKYAEIGRPMPSRVSLYREVVRDGLLEGPNAPAG